MRRLISGGRLKGEAVGVEVGEGALRRGRASRFARRAFVLAAFVVCLAVPGIAAAAQTIVSLSFDDGKATQYQVRPVLASHGMHATFFVNTGSVSVDGLNTYSMTWQQLHDLASDGNEIGGHTLTHEDLTMVSADEATHQVCDDRTALIAQGFAPTSFAYPYGSTNAAVKQIVQGCGYSSARTTGGLFNDCGANCPYAETIPPNDYYGTRSAGSPVESTTLAEMEGYITQAETNGGGWVQIEFHQICDACELYSTPLATLTAFLDWLQPRAANTNPTVVKTVQQALGTTAPPDTSAPVTSIACNGAACTSGGYTAPVTVALTATDNGGSGVAATRYTTNGSDPTTSSPLYSSPFTVTQTTTVKYRSWDVANNAEATHTQTVTITAPDTTPPVTSIACNGAACTSGAYTAPVTVALTATDNGGSGVAATRYTTNGNDPTTTSPLYSAPFTVTQTTTVKYRSWDNSNNAETTKTQIITVTSGAGAGGGGGGGGGGGSGAPADLRLSGALDLPNVPVGGSLVWRLRVNDATSSTATGVYVDLTLPAGVDVATATTDRGPGCQTTGTQRLRCSLDYLSGDSPVGNVLVIMRVTQPGELTLSATSGYGGTDPAPADNTVATKANSATTQPPPTPTPDHGGRPKIIATPSAPTRTLSNRGTTTTFTGTLKIDKAAHITTTVSNLHTGKAVTNLKGSNLGTVTLTRAATKLATTTKAAATLKYRLLVTTTGLKAGQPYAIIVTATNKDGRKTELRIRVRPR